MQTPIKANTESGGLMFYDPPENRIFFRGRLRVMFNDDTGKTLTRYIHIVQRRRGTFGECEYEAGGTPFGSGGFLVSAGCDAAASFDCAIE